MKRLLGDVEQVLKLVECELVVGASLSTAEHVVRKLQLTRLQLHDLLLHSVLYDKPVPTRLG